MELIQMCDVQQSWLQVPSHCRLMLKLRSRQMQDTTAGRIFRYAEYGITLIIKIKHNAEYKARG